MHVIAMERAHDNKQERRVQRMKSLLWPTLAVASIALIFMEPAFATGTTTGTGSSAAAQARIAAVATGWQNIVTAVGVAILIIAWSVIGYAIAFNGKSMKDMQNPAVGTTIAGLAPILVGWLFG